MTTAGPAASAHDLARQARTLAQSHPFSPVSAQYMNESVAEQGKSQPNSEVGVWAGACLTNGYCLRRVEENHAGLVLQLQADCTVSVSDLAAEATRLATSLRTGGAGISFLIAEDSVIEALDHIIASEVSKRLDNLRNAIDKEAAGEVEDFLVFWTVQGYALRVAEQALGMVA